MPGRCIPESDFPWAVGEAADLFSLPNLYRCYLDCRRNKRGTAAALAFEARLELNLLALRDELVSRTYRPLPSAIFFATRPKLREIVAAEFRDRIVHHVLVHHLEPSWERHFVHDSYACRRGRGAHAAVARLRQGMRGVTRSGKRPGWYLQLDIANFFMSVDLPVLRGLVLPRIRDPQARWLATLLLADDANRQAVLRASPRLAAAVPPHKSLFAQPVGKGLPIGNHTSQFFANVYLDGLDQFVKHRLRCRHYLRYCDDFVLLSEDPGQLARWRDEIGQWLLKERRLALNARQRLSRVSDGVDFLGYVVRPDYTLVRRRVVNNMKARITGLSRLLHSGANGRVWQRFEASTVAALQAALASYAGHLKWADARRLERNVLDVHPWIDDFLWRPPRTSTHRARALEPRACASARAQYRWFRAQRPADLLFFQVGPFFEFLEPGEDDAAHALGLRRLGTNRRGARHGFPRDRLPEFVRRAAALGRSISIVMEDDGPYAGRVKRRRMAWRVLALPAAPVLASAEQTVVQLHP